MSIVKNINNQYDYIGNLHNLAMKYKLPAYEQGTTTPSQSNLYNSTISFLQSSGYGTSPYDDIYLNECSYNLYRYPTSPSSDSIIIILYNNSLISSAVKTKAQQLNTLLSSINDSIVPTQIAYNNYANTIVTYETQTIASSSLSTNDKLVLLATYSVARHSLEYWMNYKNSQNLIPNQIAGNGIGGTSRVVTTKNWFKVAKVVSSDWSGALAGATLGRVIATSQGLQPQAHEISGAFGGATVASLSSSVKQIWDHYFN